MDYKLIECEFSECCDKCCFGQDEGIICNAPEALPICEGGYYG